MRSQFWGWAKILAGVLFLLALFYLVQRQLTGWSLGLLVFFAFWEKVMPRRSPKAPLVQRWIGNLGIFVFNTSLVQLVVIPNLSRLINSYSWGNWDLMDLFPLNPWASALVSILLLDLTTYGIHRMFHQFSWGWKIHRVHHADLDVDVTTAQRFHPLEILISLILMQLFMIVVGPPMRIFIFYNLSVFMVGVFRHANIRVPGPLQGLLKWFLVTPDMHLIHHSVDWKESNSNFGTNFPWWDHFFHTYVESPKNRFERMKLGVTGFSSPQNSDLWWMALIPFLKRQPAPRPGRIRQ